MKSTEGKFGKSSKAWLRGFLIAAVRLMAMAAIQALARPDNVLVLTLELLGVWAFGWHMAWQLVRLNINDPSNCLKLFRSNRDAGLLVGLFFAGAAVL